MYISKSEFLHSENISEHIKSIYQSTEIPKSLAKCAKPILELWNQNHKKSQDKIILF